jgi:hypothetical protein
MALVRTEAHLLTRLAASFSETRGTRTRRALIEVVARRPDMTLEELAALAAANPELYGMTLDDLLAELRHHVRQLESRGRAPAEPGRIVLTEAEVERLAEILDREVEPTPGLRKALTNIADPHRQPPRVRWKTSRSDGPRRRGRA